MIHLRIKPVAWEVICRVLFGSVWQGQKCGTWWSCFRLERSNWAIHFGRGLRQMRFHLPYWLRLTVMHSVGNDSRQKWCLKSGVSLRLDAQPQTPSNVCLVRVDTRWIYLLYVFNTLRCVSQINFWNPNLPLFTGKLPCMQANSYLDAVTAFCKFSHWLSVHLLYTT